jgi:tetratricopeptide (TPR) repeat protein
MGSPDKAVEEYRRALSYRPNYGEAYSGLGDAYVIKGMKQKAMEEYSNAIEALPVSALISVPAYNNLAYLYAEEEQDLDKALSLAQKAMQLAPKHPDISDTIGWIHYKKGAYEEAVANLKDAVKGSPNNPTIRYHLGAAYYKQSAKEKALAELEKALEISDTFEGAEETKQLLIELGAR